MVNSECWGSLHWYPDFPIHIVILHKVLDKTYIQSDLFIIVKYIISKIKYLGLKWRGHTLSLATLFFNDIIAEIIFM